MSQTVLHEWVRVLDRPATFWASVARTFCAWSRADPYLPRQLRGADIGSIKIRLAALLELAAREGVAPAVVARARFLHDFARDHRVPTITETTYRHMLGTLTAALRDHGVPRDIVTPYCAVFEQIGPDVVGDWKAGLHPYLRPRPGAQQLCDSAALLDYARRTGAAIP